MIEQLQKQIETAFNKKVTVRKVKSGSMRGYVIFKPKRKSTTEFPKFDHSTLPFIRKQIGSGQEPRPNFFSVEDIAVYIGNEIFNSKY